MKYIQSFAIILIITSIITGCSCDNDLDITENTTDVIATVQETNNDNAVEPVCINPEYTPSEDYSVYVQTEGDIHFSFEYPDIFQSSIQHEEYSEYTRVWFFQPFNNDGETGYLLEIEVTKSNEVFQDVHEKIEFTAEIRDHWNCMYYVIDHSQIDIHGIQGEQIISTLLSYTGEVSYGTSLDYWKQYYEQLVPSFYREVYFDNEGWVWELRLDTPIESFSEYDEAFDHIIDTFQILD